jgi:hypothetical protein
MCDIYKLAQFKGGPLLDCIFLQIQNKNEASTVSVCGLALLINPLKFAWHELVPLGDMTKQHGHTHCCRLSVSDVAFLALIDISTRRSVFSPLLEETSQYNIDYLYFHKFANGFLG